MSYQIPMRDAFVVAKFTKMEDAEACKREGDTIEVDSKSTAKDAEGNLKQVHLKRPIKTVGELNEWPKADGEFDSMTVHEWRRQVGFTLDDALRALRTGSDLAIRSMQENAVTKPCKVSQKTETEQARNTTLAKIMANPAGELFAETLAKLQASASSAANHKALAVWLDDHYNKV